MYENIGQYVKMRRVEMGLSLREFGKLCQMSHTHIDSIEKGMDVRTGRKVNLTGATVAKLAQALDMTESQLVNACESEKKSEAPATDRQLKLALFGDGEADSALLDEVRQFAQFIKNRG